MSIDTTDGIRQAVRASRASEQAGFAGCNQGHNGGDTGTRSSDGVLLKQRRHRGHTHTRTKADGRLAWPARAPAPASPWETTARSCGPRTTAAPGAASSSLVQGLVATFTAPATPARPGAIATRVPASPCRRALPLHVGLSSRTVRSAGTGVIRARTVSRARLSVVARVLAHKTVVTGTGTHRRRVVRTIGPTTRQRGHRRTTGCWTSRTEGRGPHGRRGGDRGAVLLPRVRRRAIRDARRRAVVLPMPSGSPVLA